MLWEFLRDAYDDFYKLVIFNLLWVGTTLLIVTAPAGAAGMYYAVNLMAHHEQVDWRTFFEGFRRYRGLGWRWFLTNLFALSIFLFNFWFYSRYPAAWSHWAQGLFLGIIILWLLLQVFTFPLLLEQQDRKLHIAIRNSLVLYIKRPSLSLGLALLLAGLLILSSLLWVPWLLFTASLSVYLATRVAVSIISTITTANTPTHTAK